MKRILVIQFRTSGENRKEEMTCLRRCMSDTAALTSVSALDTSVPWHDPELVLSSYDGVVLGGSGDFDFDGGRAEGDPARRTSYEFLERLSPLCAHVFATDTPTFGICYGHQLIAAWTGAQVRHDPVQQKTGTYLVSRTALGEQDGVFETLPDTIHAQYGHKDSVCDVPQQSVLLMDGGERCRAAALRYHTAIYTTQFHPELRGVDMINRLNRTPGYIPEGVSAEEVVVDDPHGEMICRRFVTEVVTSL